MAYHELYKPREGILIHATYSNGRSGFKRGMVTIQLFRQRLSYESVKVYATLSIGIVGSKSLALLD